MRNVYLLHLYSQSDTCWEFWTHTIRKTPFFFFYLLLVIIIRYFHVDCVHIHSILYAGSWDKNKKSKRKRRVVGLKNNSHHGAITLHVKHQQDGVELTTKLFYEKGKTDVTNTHTTQEKERGETLKKHFFFGRPLPCGKWNNLSRSKFFDCPVSTVISLLRRRVYNHRLRDAGALLRIIEETDETAVAPIRCAQRGLVMLVT